MAGITELSKGFPSKRKRTIILLGAPWTNRHGFVVVSIGTGTRGGISELGSVQSIHVEENGVYAISSNDIRVGTNVEVDGAPWKVLEFLHVKPGKGAAFVRTKLRNRQHGGENLPGWKYAPGTIPFKGDQAIYMQGWLPVRVHGSDII